MKRVLGVVLLLAGCQTLTEEMPVKQGTSLNPVAPGVVPSVYPVQLPSPSTGGGGTPSPTPTPSAGAPSTPTPTPTPAPTSAGGCNLPPGTGDGQYCPREGASGFQDAVESALDQVIREHPEYFNVKDQTCSGCPLVTNGPGYERAVIAALEQRGLCAVGGEEYGVKNTNAFNDQFDLLTADWHVRRGEGAYRGTCRPAAF